VRAAEAQATYQTPVPFPATALFDGLAGETSVAIAVSGGSDSVALLRLAHKAGFKGLVALTVDHGLRAESAAEANQVTQWCDDLGIEHHVLRWEGAKPSTGLQAKARAARYDAMTGFCATRGIRSLLTAHTLDDQAETFVMRAARTDSLAALAGIWPETMWNGIRVLRPLLSVRRDSLRAWLTACGQGWIDDPSNEDSRFERVRVRKALGARNIETFAVNADAARDGFRRIDATSDDWINASVERRPESHFVFARVALLSQPKPIQFAVLSKLVGKSGDGQPLMTTEVNRLVAALDQPQRRTLGNAVIAIRHRDVIIAREAGRIGKGWIRIGAERSAIWDRRFRVFGPLGAEVGAAGWVHGLARPEGVPHYVFAGYPVVRHDGRLLVPAKDGEVSAELL
jgi:tRNA(Ile)-lysidine synthase